MAQEAIQAEDTQADANNIPRYAAYSVWRPVRTVKRDPLVVGDYRTLDKTEMVENEYRALSEINEGGEYTMEYWAVLPPKDPNHAQYHYVPDMQPDEVLVVKFADTEAERNEQVAAYCPHGAVVLPGTDEEEPRVSIECRVLAFW